MAGTGYTYQDNFVILGGRTTGGTISNSSLGTYPTFANTATFDTGGMSKLNMNVRYNMGASETSNIIHIRVESSPDNINFYQIPNESVSGGISTLTQREFRFTATTATVDYMISLPLDVQDEHMRFAFAESGVASNAGSAFAEITLSGDK